VWKQHFSQSSATATASTASASPAGAFDDDRRGKQREYLFPNAGYDFGWDDHVSLGFGHDA
jgi:hypothetical protein